MMKRVLVIVSMAALAAAAGTAQATEVVAGWDFSQYFTPGHMTIDDASPFAYVSTLDANYSGLDPTHCAGAESALAGTLFMNGSFGSSSISPGPGLSAVVPVSRRVDDYGVNVTGLSPAGRAGVTDIPKGEGEITSNLNPPGCVHFNKFGVLRHEGQANTELLSLLADSATSVVFRADAAAGGMSSGTGPWGLSFGGRSLNFEGPDSDVDIYFTPDCGYPTEKPEVLVASAVHLTEEDGAFSFGLPLPAPFVTARSGCVRMDLGAGSIIDNVAVSATALPEPGVAMGLLAGMSLLAGLRRFRT